MNTTKTAKSTKSSYQSKRKYPRYKPETDTFVTIETKGGGKAYTPNTGGLVFSESYGGCGIVLLATNELQTGDICMAKIGPLHPMRAQVVWRTQLDNNVIKIGIKFLE